MLPFGPLTLEQFASWRNRERGRLQDGTYKPIPYLLELNGIAIESDHFLHLSVTDGPDMIAFTPNDEKGLADRQVSMKFGRYLKQYYQMDDVSVHACVVALRLALQKTDSELHFATDVETINDIFETCMHALNSNAESCMFGKFDDWDDRPYHVYADSPDVAVAYLKHNGSIIARSVVSVKDSTYVRLYATRGDETTGRRLETALKDAGYSKGELMGNRLTILPESRGEVILPYIDNSGQYVEKFGKYWRVCEKSNADYECDRTDGTASQSVPCCSSCDRREDECQCSVCHCCEERSTGGCPDCVMCEDCDNCITHDSCSCSRCPHCSELNNPRHRSSRECECNICENCDELEENCDCIRCEECNELEENCDCEAPLTTMPGPTVLIVRSSGKQSYRMPVLASYRYAGFIFFAHRDIDNHAKFRLTYGPLGMSAGGSFSSIDGAITNLEGNSQERVKQTIETNLQRALEDHRPIYTPEYLNQYNSEDYSQCSN